MPSFAAILSETGVRGALWRAWMDSKPGLADRHEEGGFIVQTPEGRFDVIRWPAGACYFGSACLLYQTEWQRRRSWTNRGHIDAGLRSIYVGNFGTGHIGGQVGCVVGAGCGCREQKSSRRRC